MAALKQPISPQIVGNAFVQQYYHILCHSPQLVYRFYKDDSQLGRPEVDGSMSITTTMDGINMKICSVRYDELKFEIQSIYTQESLNGGVQVLVIGTLMGVDNTARRKFAQTFFLAPQANGYFVLNDMFSYVDSETVTPAVVVVVPPVLAVPVPAPPVENLVEEQGQPAAEEDFEEQATEEVYNPPVNEDVTVEEEEVPVAEVVDEVQDDSHVAVESSAKIEEMPKKSYASMVMDLKKIAAAIPPLAATRKVPPKSLAIPSPNVTPISSGTVSAAESVDNGANQEAEGYSIYIGGLPMNATQSMVEEVFKKFGTIKSDGIQVRYTKAQDYSFGFVEYEDPGSVQKAVEAYAVRVGGLRVDVQEKRSTYSRGNMRTFQSGSEGGRGVRDNYVGGGGNGRDGYENSRGGRDAFNARSEYVNRGGNRGGDGYRQKPESFNNSNSNSSGGQMNRNGRSKGGGKPV